MNGSIRFFWDRWSILFALVSSGACGSDSMSPQPLLMLQGVELKQGEATPWSTMHLMMCLGPNFQLTISGEQATLFEWTFDKGLGPYRPIPLQSFQGTPPSSDREFLSTQFSYEREDHLGQGAALLAMGLQSESATGRVVDETQLSIASAEFRHLYSEVLRGAHDDEELSWLVVLGVSLSNLGEPVSVELQSLLGLAAERIHSLPLACGQTHYMTSIAMAANCSALPANVRSDLRTAVERYADDVQKSIGSDGLPHWSGLYFGLDSKTPGGQLRVLGHLLEFVSLCPSIDPQSIRSMETAFESAVDALPDDIRTTAPSLGYISHGVAGLHRLHSQ